MKKGFVSDNCAGVHPAVMEVLAACNMGHAPSYGEDTWCDRAKSALQGMFEREMPISFVFNGTGANILSLACMLRPYESVVCAECAHINADETGAPERIVGSKLQGIRTADGKLRPQDIMPLLAAQGNPHHAQPRVLSLTNVTETGTVYTPDEICALCDFAHAHGLLVHMDGARIANAIAACGCSAADMTWRAGLDVLSFGGVKNGLLFGEAVLFFDASLADAAPFMRKNIAQLQSKMRYIGAQYEALLADSLWLHNASHANDMAKALASMLRTMPTTELIYPVDANMIFVRMPSAMRQAVLEAGFGAALDDTIRLVTSWDTQMEDIEALRILLSQCSTEV